MKCEFCKASHEQHYVESYACDWSCLAGVSDEDREEFSDGLLGCRLHYKTVEKRMKVNEELWLKDKEDFVNWYLKEKELGE